MFYSNFLRIIKRKHQLEAMIFSTYGKKSLRNLNIYTVLLYVKFIVIEKGNRGKSDPTGVLRGDSLQMHSFTVYIFMLVWLVINSVTHWTKFSKPHCFELYFVILQAIQRQKYSLCTTSSFSPQLVLKFPLSDLYQGQIKVNKAKNLFG